MTDADLQHRLTAMFADGSQRPIDTDGAWRELRLRRSRAGHNRRRWLAAAAAASVVAVVATAIPLLSGSLSAAPPGRHPTGPASRPSTAPGTFRSYPGAIVARIAVSGVVDVVQAGARAWAVRNSGSTASDSYQLVGIDLRTDRSTLRVNLGRSFRAVVAGHGMVWLTTTKGQAQGQLERIDPATGGVITTLHLPVGRCSYATYGGGRLWAQCADGRGATLFLRINPVTGVVDGRFGPVRGQFGSIAVAPQGVWYNNYSGISGLVGAGSAARAITVRDPAYPVSFAYAQSLVYSQGFIWVLTNDESVAKINPATGRVVRVYTYASYDPADNGGLDFLAAGGGSLWFLDDGYPFSGVLRVSEATGRPLGGVTVPSGSCGEACWQIYVSGSAVWVPTMESLLRIDPARLPG